MRRVILFSFVAVGLFLAGCSDQSSIVEPTQQISQQQGLTLIDLPVSSLDKSIKASGIVNGENGGEITFEGTLRHGKITVSGSLVIPEGAFEGTREISIKLNKKTASFNFGPSGTFDEPLLFNATITGLNLHGFNKADFVYVSKKGKLTVISSEASGNDDGTLYVVNAELNHFSRYGWAK